MVHLYTFKMFSTFHGAMKVKSLSRVQLCNPMDSSLPGFSIHGIFQARIQEWVAISWWNTCEQYYTKQNIF